MLRILISSLFASAALGACATIAPPAPEPQFVRSLPGLPFDHYRNSPVGAPDLDFYLAPAESAAPLLVFIQGSGCGSAFGVEEDGSVFSTLAQERIVQMVDDRFSVLVVDKVGVEPGAFPDDGGEMAFCSETTRANHTLDTWAARLGDAIDQAKSLAPVDQNRPISLLGFSEGAVASARVAALRQDVGHVTFISGFGCGLFDDLVTLAQREWRANHPDVSAEERQAGNTAAAAAILGQVETVLATPDAMTPLFEGHTPKYWSSVGYACPAEDLARSNAEVFVAVGMDDQSMVAEGADEIVLRRLRQGKSTKINRVVGGNHGLGTASDENPFARLLATFEEAIAWMATG